MMVMVVGMRVGVVQVRERLLELLQVRLGLTVVALENKEMRQGAAGNCHESGFCMGVSRLGQISCRFGQILEGGKNATAT